MQSVFSIVGLGFLLGMRHATDADHVVAITTLVAHDRASASMKTALRIGAVWGIGHTTTILAFGGALVAFDVTLSARVGLALELAVALMLCALGANTLAHAYLARFRGANAPPPAPHRHQTVRSLLIGCVHGLAGSAAIALMVVASIHSLRTALAYLFVFGLGTIAGMALVTAALAAPMTFAAMRARSPTRHLAWISGVLSIGLGLGLVYQIGIVDGLFTDHVRWQPH